MLNVEHDVVFTAHNKDGKFDLIHGSLQSGNIYLLDTPCLIPDLLASLDYLDERIIISFVKKIVAEKKVPLIAFTREDLAFKIVTGRHVVQAALKLDIDHIKGIYVPRSALETGQVEQVFL